MNWVDLVILGTVGGAVLAGVLRGAVRTLFSAAGLVIGFLVASRESGAAAVVLGRWLRHDLAAAIGFGVVLLGAAVAFALAGWLVRKLLEGLLLGWVDRLAGGALGFLQAAVVLGTLALVIEGLGPFPATRRSVTYPLALQAGRLLLQAVPPETRQRLRWGRLRERLEGPTPFGREVI